jgi:2,4-dienoyl-CoA reductase-like NADH-dependent reductase (Old Yellow Enzyme family)
MTSIHPLLEPITIADVPLRNRVVVAPMSRVSTAGDGVPTETMAAYYADYARGGFGLVISEGTYTDHAHSQAYANQPAIVTDTQVRAWARVADRVHDAGGRMFLQLMHAGALVQGTHHRDVAIAPSAIRPKGRKLVGYGGHGRYALPREMTAADIAEAVAGFAASAARARTAGFDGVEVHAANGYLLDQFLTTYTNRRTDGYGGPAANRTRALVEVINAIHGAAGDDFPVGVRVSQVKVNDLEYRWSGQAEAEGIFASLRAASPAYIHVASEGAHWDATSFLAPGVSITGVARRAAGVPVIANGGMHDPVLGSRLLYEEHADLVSIGHGALANPDWPARLADGRACEPFDAAMLRPEVTIENTERWRQRRREPQANEAREAALRRLSLRGDRVADGHFSACVGTE